MYHLIITTMNRFIECLFKLENAFKSKYAKITN